MNTKFMASSLIAAASLVSVNVFAAGADGGIDTPAFNTVSTVSRAEVRAQALAAKQGPVTASYQVDGGTVVTGTPAATGRSRADVRAEAVQARASATGDSAPGRG